MHFFINLSTLFSETGVFHSTQPPLAIAQYFHKLFDILTAYTLTPNVFRLFYFKQNAFFEQFVNLNCDFLNEKLDFVKH